jgi:hypothetical protein
MKTLRKTKKVDQAMSVVPKGDLKRINAKLDGELFKLARNWNSAKRFTTASTMALWSSQLSASAMRLQAVENKHLLGIVDLN